MTDIKSSKHQEFRELRADDRGRVNLRSRTVASTDRVQTTVLISFDGWLDAWTSRAMCSRVRDLLDLGIRMIFLDLSGVDGVDALGFCHLIEMLDYADAIGGGVAILERSDELTAYIRDIEVAD